MKDIETLLNKYFEGETTCEEERLLRRFFTEGLVPEHLQIYRPMFAFFEAEHEEANRDVSDIPEISQLPALVALEKKTKSFRQHITYSLGAAAAALLLLIGISGVFRHLSPTPDSYVVIDGKQYTDKSLVHEQAMAAFRDVSLSEEDIFATLFE